MTVALHGSGLLIASNSLKNKISTFPSPDQELFCHDFA